MWSNTAQLLRQGEPQHCKAPFSVESSEKRRLCEADTEREGHTHTAVNAELKLLAQTLSVSATVTVITQLSPYSTDTARLRLPPRCTNKIPDMRLTRQPQNKKINSVDVLKLRWSAEAAQLPEVSQVRPTPVTGHWLSPRVKEFFSTPSMAPACGLHTTRAHSRVCGLMDGLTATQWLMLQVVSHSIGGRSQVAVDSLYHTSAAPWFESDGSPETGLSLIIQRQRATAESEACQPQTSSPWTSNAALCTAQGCPLESKRSEIFKQLPYLA